MDRFKTIAIIGVGLIGGSLSMALKRKLPDIKILGVDKQKVIDEAISLSAIDQGFTTEQMEECAALADLVVLATPISQIIDYLPKVSRAIRPGTLVTDTGSTKTKIVETAERCFKDNIYFLGGHPMTGSEGRGIKSADALLFENTIYVLTPSQKLPGHVVQNFGSLIEKIGSRLILLSPTMHDKIAAAVSHLPQILAVSLMNSITQQQGDSTLFIKLAAGGFRDITRIASSPYEIWKDIINTNKEQLLNSLDAFIEYLERTKDKITKGNLSEDFHSAMINRLSIPRDTKGFLHPHFDLSVQVEDKPGVIAVISTTLAGEEINIKDIEVLKVREGDAGTLRISFETEKARERAHVLLNSIGYPCRKRE